MMLGNLLSSVQLQAFLEWTFLTVCSGIFTIPFEEHFQVALEMMEMGISSSL
jgi:hypothetical protein